MLRTDGGWRRLCFYPQKPWLRGCFEQRERQNRRSILHRSLQYRAGNPGECEHWETRVGRKRRKGKHKSRSVVCEKLVSLVSFSDKLVDPRPISLSPWQLSFSLLPVVPSAGHCQNCNITPSRVLMSIRNEVLSRV